MPSNRFAPLLLLCVGVLMGLGLASYYVWPLLDPPYVERHILASFGLFALYLVAVWASKDLPAGGWLWCFLLMGLVFHLIVMPLAPSLSDDFFRYLWDGRLHGHGLNPFSYPPMSSQLDALTEPFHHPFINHPHYRTVYPPMAQLVFWAGYWLTPGSFLGYKLLLLLSLVAMVGLLAVWLRRRGKPMGRLLWVAWCPLPMFEVMLDGHLDGLAPALLVAVLLAAQRRRPWLCGVALGMVLLVKPLPLFVVPLLLWHLRWRRALQMCVACGLTCLLLYLPMLDAGAFLFQTLRSYSQHWSFNGPIYELLVLWLPQDVTRRLLVVGILCVALATPFLRLPLRLEQRFVIPLVAYFSMTPTLYPWYIVWLVPWLILAPGPWLFWLVGTITSAHFVHYVHVRTGWWYLDPLVMAFEFIPLALLLLAQVGLFLWRCKRRWVGWPWSLSRRWLRTQQAQEMVQLQRRVAALEAELQRGQGR